MIELLLFIVNGGGWAFKPILEKISVDKFGFYYFSFMRYIITALISIPFLIYYHYHNVDYPKLYKNNHSLFFTDIFLWGSIVSIVALSAILANYYLLEKYNSHFVTTITEGILLIFNAIFSAIILGEKITLTYSLGLLSIIFGIFIVYYDKVYSL